MSQALQHVGGAQGMADPAALLAAFPQGLPPQLAAQVLQVPEPQPCNDRALLKQSIYKQSILL